MAVGRRGASAETQKIATRRRGCDVDVSWFSNIAYQRYYLASAGVSVPGPALLADDDLCALAAEDIAWSTAMADWHRRTPSRLRPGPRRRWVAEGRFLYQERDRLRELARGHGLLG
jgi:hypothetical protein